MPGSRVAANLVGITTSQLQRGDVLTRPGWLIPTKMLTVKLRLLSYLPRPLRHNANVNFYTGATETMARVRLLEGDKVQPGESMWAQMLLDRPVAIVSGDHFIIRSPEETLGGGKIVDSRARRLHRGRPSIIQNLKAREEGTPGEVIMALLETKQSLEMTTLLAQSNLPANEARSVIESFVQQGQIVEIGQGKQSLLMTAPGWEQLAQKAVTIVQDYHHRFPARPGMPKVELGSRLKLGNYTAEVLQNLFDQGVLVEDGAVAFLPAHHIQLTQEQQTRIDTFLRSLAQNPYAPPGELIPEPDLLNLLIGQDKVVKVSDSVVFSTSGYDEMVDGVTSYIKEHGKVSLAEVRDLFKTSRKYAQAFLEHLDAKKITRRVGDERVLY